MAKLSRNIKLRKHEESAIDSSDPWAGDCLERWKAADILGRVLRTIEQPFVVAINAPFGTGKSYFVQRLLQQFRNEGQVALYFNAWEKDNQTQPLLSFVGELQGQFDQHYGIKKTRKSMKALTKGAGIYALRKFVPGLVRVATAGVIGDEGIKGLGNAAEELISGAGSLAEDLVEHQIETEKAQADFRKNLEKAASDALAKAGNEAKAVYIFVDELDRCRPPFALELLENIKHLFSVPGYNVYRDYAVGRLQWDQLADVIRNENDGAAWLSNRKNSIALAWLVLGNQNDKEALAREVNRCGNRVNEISNSGISSTEGENERRVLEPRRNLFSQAHSIASDLSWNYPVLDGQKESPAEITFRALELAADFGNE